MSTVQSSTPTAPDPTVPSDGWRALVLPILVVPASLIGGLVTFGSLNAAGTSEDTQLAASVAVGGLVLLVLAGLLWRRLPDERRRAMVAGSGEGTAIDIAAGLATALVLLFVAGGIVLAGLALDSSVKNRIEELDTGLPAAAWQIGLMVVGLAILAPLGEELLFRGLILDGFRRLVAFPAAAGASGVLFAAAHLDAWLIWPRAIALAVIGIALAEVYRRRGFLTVVTAHAGINCAALGALAASG